ncbi:hypothetical protein PVAP13_2NG380600 [Panicum virgatum]|uniref:Uncharacterized protein n=1 Tax=Panicum virgatum TaxID=38727 RepID=A0A8T0VKK0_PANVG|nr:hypothetical protein PVAP13_2NG380600 [Panicum virgatum]
MKPPRSKFWLCPWPPGWLEASASSWPKHEMLMLVRICGEFDRKFKDLLWNEVANLHLWKEETRGLHEQCSWCQEDR